MKAVIYKKYGFPEVLQMKEIEKPIPKENEVLIKIYAVSVNSSDWELLIGKPLYTRIWGVFKPARNILGSDITGEIESVGNKVTRFKPGDKVFGDLMGSWGGFAEYVCAAENAIFLKPEGIKFEELAAIPQAGVVALQGLRDKGKIQSGQKVLINGAGGGAGTFAIQIAKMFGAHVTGVDHTEKLDLMRSVGADQVIDYTKENFTKNGKQYHLILDLVAHRSVFDFKRTLFSGGRYVMAGGSMAAILQFAFLGAIVSKISNRKLGILSHRQNKKDLEFMIELFKTGKVLPVVDKCFSLHETAEALRYLGEGHAKGKIIIQVCNLA